MICFSEYKLVPTKAPIRSVLGYETVKRPVCITRRIGEQEELGIGMTVKLQTEL